MVPHVKPAVDPLALRHKELLRGRFWAHIPAYAEVDEETCALHANVTADSTRT